MQAARCSPANWHGFTSPLPPTDNNHARTRTPIICRGVFLGRFLCEVSFRNKPDSEVMLGSLRLLKETNRTVFFINCATLFPGLDQNGRQNSRELWVKRGTALEGVLFWGCLRGGSGALLDAGAWGKVCNLALTRR